MTSFNTDLKETKHNYTLTRNYTDVNTLSLNFENMPKVSEEVFLASDYYKSTAYTNGFFTKPNVSMRFIGKYMFFTGTWVYNS